jgi:hypothetical protein
MTFFQQITCGLFALWVILAALFLRDRLRARRKPWATPRSPMTGGLPGLREERAEIRRRLKREHVEMQMLDPDDDGFSDEYDERSDRKDRLGRELQNVDHEIEEWGQ